MACAYFPDDYFFKKYIKALKDMGFITVNIKED